MPLGSQGRLVVDHGSDRSEPSAVARLLGRLLPVPGAGDWERSVVFDSRTGEVLGRATGRVRPDLCDGRLLLVDTDDDRPMVWRLPPADLPARVAGLAAGWGLAVGLAARWWGRRRGG